MADFKEIIPCDNPSGIVVFDTETTGLKPYDNDEILQISMVDGNGNILLNSLVKPVNRKRWPNAQAVNGISPKMVKDAPTLEELAPTIRGILDSAKILVAYNVKFDSSFLRATGLGFGNYIHPGKTVDVMIDFAEVYGQWDEYHGDYKWQKLTKCASYYNFDWKTTGTNAHDSLGDTLATLYCYKKVEADLKKKREETKRRTAERKQQIHEEKLNFLTSQREYFNPEFIEDTHLWMDEYHSPYREIKLINPKTLKILAILLGMFAADRWIIAFKVNHHPDKKLAWCEAGMVFLKFILVIPLGIFIVPLVGWLVIYIYDIIHAEQHAKIINEKIVLWKDVSAYKGRY